MEKLNSLTIFFPFYNDEGTVELAITQAFEIGTQVAKKLEVIAIHGGNSKDNTFQQIQVMKKKFPGLRILDHSDNKIGYAVIKYGFEAATSDWIFYTDGDLQYNVEALLSAIKLQEKTGVTVVNGYKLNRGDSWHRIFLGKVYQRLSQKIFDLPIRDVDCDFRLIKKSALDKITLYSTHAAILPELIYKLKITGATFAELPVTHLARRYGSSNYSWWKLTWEKISGDTQLFFKLRTIKQNLEKSHS